MAILHKPREMNRPHHYQKQYEEPHIAFGYVLTISHYLRALYMERKRVLEGHSPFRLRPR